MDEETIRRFEAIEERLKHLEKNKGEGKEISPVSSEIWDVEGENLNLLKTKGESTKEKTKNTALLVLLGYKNKLGKNKILASDLRRSIALHKVPLENFGTHLNELIPQSIIRIGKVGSTKAEYKLTFYGEALAKELLNELEEYGKSNNKK